MNGLTSQTSLVDIQTSLKRIRWLPGKFQDKCPNNAILEFAGLRAKMYSILTKNADSKKTAKGVSQRVTNRELKHEYYKRCLIDDEEMYHNMVRIGHTHHQLQTIKALKKSISPYSRGVQNVKIFKFQVPKELSWF